MNFDPQKFFIGMMDFFSILLPGALLTYLLMGGVGPVLLGDRYWQLDGTEAWAAFLLASYLVGHLIFLLGSWLDVLYDWVRRYTLNAQVTRLAHRERLLPWLTRALIWLLFKGERNLAVDRAAKIKGKALAGLQAKDAINTFQWCKALLHLESPESLAVVQRFEADSKFFRCFTVVLLLLLPTWPLHHRWPPQIGIPVVLLMVLLALWRYMELRLKSTNQAYWSVITLAAREGKTVLDDPAPVAGNPSHAGGVVLRIHHGEPQCLMVEARDDPGQWVLPKGHVEEGEHPRQAAVREVHEETGVWARIVRDLGVVSYSVHKEVVSVRFFVMRPKGYGFREEYRRYDWCDLKEAIERAEQAKHPETHEILWKAIAQTKHSETDDELRRAVEERFPPRDR